MIIGRDRELAAARSALASSDSAGLLLTGEAGVGKSALATALLAGFDSETTLVVYGSVGAHELPYGCLTASLPTESDAASASAPQALRSLVQSSAAPSVILIDDGDLIDRASAEALAQVTDGGRVKLIVTQRDGTKLHAPLVRLPGGRALHRIELDPFDAVETASLAAAVLGAPLAARSISTVQRSTLGNPLYVVELLRVARDEGRTRRVGDQIELTAIPATSGRLVDLVTARLDGLTEGELDLLARVAAATPAGPGELGPDFASDTIERLVDSGLLTVTLDGRRQRLRLGHPIHGEVLRASLTPVRARRIRAEVAASIESHGGRRREDRMRLAAWSLDGDYDAGPDLLIEAAQTALLAADTDLSARLAVAGFEAAPGFETGRVAEVALYEQGDSQRLFAHHARWAAHVRTDAERAVFDVAVAKGAFWRAMDPAPLDTLVADLPELPFPGPLTVRRAEAAAMLVVRGHIDGALELAEPHRDDPPSRESVLFALALAHGHRAAGRPETACTGLRRAADIFQALGDNVFAMSENVVSSVRTQALAEAGRFAEAEAAASRSLALAHETDAHKASGLAYLALGWTRYLAGRYEDAERALVSASASLEYVAHPGMIRWTTGVRALLYASSGNLELGRSLIAELDDQAHPAEIFESNVERARAWLAAGERDSERASELLTSRARVELANGNVVSALGCLLDLARLDCAEAAEPLLARIGELEGDLLPVHRAYVEARASRSVEELERAAKAAAAVGVPVLAAELIEQAALAAPDDDAPLLLRRAAELWVDAGVPVEDQANVEALRLLTDREREIAGLAAQGFTSKAIAERLFISPRTVDTHLARIYQKVGVSGRAGLAKVVARRRQSSPAPPR